MKQKAFQKRQSIVQELIYSMGDRLSTVLLQTMVAHYTSVINKMIASMVRHTFLSLGAMCMAH